MFRGRYKQFAAGGNLFDTTNPFWNQSYQYIPREYLSLGVDNYLQATQVPMPEEDTMPDLKDVKTKVADAKVIPYDAELLNRKLTDLEVKIKNKLQINPYAFKNDPSVIRDLTELQGLATNPDLTKAKITRERMDNWYNEITKNNSADQFYVDPTGKVHDFTNSEFYQGVMRGDERFRDIYAQQRNQLANVETNQRFGTLKDLNEELDTAFGKIKNNLTEGGFSNKSVQLLGMQLGQVGVDSWEQAAGFMKNKTGREWSIETNEDKLNLAKAMLADKWRNRFGPQSKNAIEQLSAQRMKVVDGLTYLPASVKNMLPTEQQQMLKGMTAFEAYQNLHNGTPQEKSIAQAMFSNIQDETAKDYVFDRAGLYKQTNRMDKSVSEQDMDVNLEGLGGAGAKNKEGEADSIHDFMTENVDYSEYDKSNVNPVYYVKENNQVVQKQGEKPVFTLDLRKLNTAASKVFDFSTPGNLNVIRQPLKVMMDGTEFTIKDAIEPLNSSIALKKDMNTGKSYVTKTFFLPEEALNDLHIYTVGSDGKPVDTPLGKKGWAIDNRSKAGIKAGIRERSIGSVAESLGLKTEDEVTKILNQLNRGDEIYEVTLDIEVTPEEYMHNRQNMKAVDDERYNQQQIAKGKYLQNAQKQQNLTKRIYK